MTSWRDGAACQGQYTEDFYPELGQADTLQRVCNTCPVLTECAIASVPEVYGLWAGTYGVNRRSARRKVGYVVAPLDADVDRFNRAAERVHLGGDPVVELGGEIGGASKARKYLDEILR